VNRAPGGDPIESAMPVVESLSQQERDALAVELGTALDQVPDVRIKANEPADVLKELSETKDPRWDVVKALVLLYVKTARRGELIHLLRYVSPISWPPQYIEEVVVFGFGDHKPENLLILLEAARTARGKKSKPVLVNAVKRCFCATGVFVQGDSDQAVLDKAERWLSSKRSELILNRGYEPTECSQIVLQAKGQ
jgi:hypothetical protein